MRAGARPGAFCVPEEPAVPSQPHRPLRRFGLSTSLWLFGIATSVLLVSLWGRGVSADDDTLAAAAGAIAESDWLAERVAGWLAEEVAEHGGLPEGKTAAVVESVWRRPETQAAVADLVGQAVEAGLASPGTTVVIDPAASIRPLTDDIAAGLTAAGVATTRQEVAAVIDEIDPVVAVAEPGETAGVVRRVRTMLNRALLTALAAMAITAAAALAISDDRRAVVRSLLTRVALTALGFAVLFHAGAWALDPSGGAAPLPRGAAVLLRSNTFTLWALAAVAAVAAAWAYRGGVHSARTSPAGSTRAAPPVQ